MRNALRVSTGRYCWGLTWSIAESGTEFYPPAFHRGRAINGWMIVLRHTKLTTCGDEAQATPLFARFARWVERQVGRSSTFVLAIAVVVLWAISGPIFGWSDTWQLVNHMARNSLINLEEMSEIDVERMKTAFATLASIETPVSRSAEVAGRAPAA